MANPNYASLLAQIAAETDPVAKAALEAQLVIVAELTEEEIELFEYTFDIVKIIIDHNFMITYFIKIS